MIFPNNCFLALDSDTHLWSCLLVQMQQFCSGLLVGPLSSLPDLLLILPDIKMLSGHDLAAVSCSGLLAPAIPSATMPSAHRMGIWAQPWLIFPFSWEGLIHPLWCSPLGCPLPFSILCFLSSPISSRHPLVHHLSLSEKKQLNRTECYCLSRGR